MSYKNVVRDERDGKNWDANIQKPHKDLLFEQYSKLNPQLLEHAMHGLDVKGVSNPKDGPKIMYFVMAPVKSGHKDTSSGNAFLNIVLSVDGVLKLPRRLRPKRLRALIIGDDYVAWLYYDREIDWQELYDELNKMEATLGIQPVRGLFDDLRRVSFASLAFYLAKDGTYVAKPKIGRMLTGLFWTCTPLAGRCPKGIARGIAHAFYPTYSTYSPMRAFLRHHMQVSPDLSWDRDDYLKWSERLLSKQSVPIDWNQNHLIKYGPESLLLQLDFAENQGAGLHHDHIVDIMAEIDCSDPTISRGAVAGGL